MFNPLRDGSDESGKSYKWENRLCRPLETWRRCHNNSNTTETIL